MTELTSKQKETLIDMGYPYNQTMKMVEMRLKGLTYAEIGKRLDRTKDAVRHQLEAFEKVTGKRLLGHKDVNKIKVVTEYDARVD